MNVAQLVTKAMREDRLRRVQEQQSAELERIETEQIATLQSQVTQLTSQLEKLRAALAQVQQHAELFKTQHRDAMAALLVAQSANEQLHTKYERLQAQLASERQARAQAEVTTRITEQRAAAAELTAERERAARLQERAQQLPLPVTYNSAPPPPPKSWTIVVSRRDGADRVRELKVSAGEE